MISFAHDDEVRHIAVEGFISRQQYARYDRSGIFLFVNNRWIKNNHLVKALLKGYLNALPPARYPAAAIFITINQAEIDVNIHPRKEEVKFLHPQVVDNLIFTGVKKALEAQLSKASAAHAQTAVVLPDADPFLEEQKIVNSAVYPLQNGPFVLSSPHSPSSASNSPRCNFGAVGKAELKEQSVAKNTDGLVFASIDPVQTIIQQEAIQQEIPSKLTQAEPEFTIIGQFNKTYIVVQQGHDLVFFDQHAAHERILYELFANRFADVAIIKLLFPLLIPVSGEQAEIAEQHSLLFEAHGLPLERFGESQLRLLAMPVYLQERAPQEIIKQIIGWIAEEKDSGADLTKLIQEKIHAKMACVAAVKAGDELSSSQMQQLITDLLTTQNNITCPHGRPTSWRVGLSDLEKRFKRDYRSVPRDEF